MEFEKPDVAKAKRIMTFSPKQITDKSFKELSFEGNWKKLIGTPSVNFCQIIHGVAKGGKSTYALKLAEYLSQWGKVAYVASEELISKTLKDRILQVGLKADNIRFVGIRNVAMLELLITRIHPRFVIIDSAQVCGLTYKEFKRLKERFKNRKSWHIILQSSNTGQFKGGQDWIHETDVKVQIVNGVAHSVGRFNQAGTMQVLNTHQDLFSELDNKGGG